MTKRKFALQGQHCRSHDSIVLRLVHFFLPLIITGRSLAYKATFQWLDRFWTALSRRTFCRVYSWFPTNKDCSAAYNTLPLAEGNLKKKRRKIRVVAIRFAGHKTLAVVVFALDTKCHDCCGYWHQSRHWTRISKMFTHRLYGCYYIDKTSFVWTPPPLLPFFCVGGRASWAMLLCCVCVEGILRTSSVSIQRSVQSCTVASFQCCVHIF